MPVHFMMTSPRCKPALSAGLRAGPLPQSRHGQTPAFAVHCERRGSVPRASVPNGPCVRRWPNRCFVAAQHFKPHRMCWSSAIPPPLRDGWCPRAVFVRQHLQLTGVGDRLSIECGNHISGAQAGFRSGCIRLNFANHRSLSFLMSKNFALSESRRKSALR